MKFDPSMKEILDSKRRKRDFPPFKILRILGVKKDMTLVDIGAGTGFFSIPASKIVGDRGKVVAIDVSKEMLREVRKKIKRNKIKNIEVRRSEEYRLPLKDEFADFALMSNVLHEVRGKIKFLREVKRIMKKDGVLAVIEWKKKKTKYGPPLSVRLTKKEIRNYLIKAGFKIKKTVEWREKLNIFLCERNG